MKKILLFGPDTADSIGAYGGGSGGYIRNMSQYLNHFRSTDFVIVPCFHTVSGVGKITSFYWRFCIDIFRFIKNMIIIRPDMVHVMAQYRRATPREFAVCVLCYIMRKPVIYEVKAGAFSTWYQSAGRTFRTMVRFCILHADTVLCEGKPTLDFIQKAIGVSGIFYPNFVSIAEIPAQVPEKLVSPAMKVLFVGYAFKNKGIYELVEGCNLAAQMIPIELNLIGHEHPDFTIWTDMLTVNKNLKINRLGRQPHDIVMDLFGKIDIYCYPTRHPGEGHNNSINEAMMHGAVIITTRHGFLETVLEDTCYFINEISPEAISSTLLQIAANKEEARTKSKQTRQRLIDNFTDELAFSKLHAAYFKALKA